MGNGARMNPRQGRLVIGVALGLIVTVVVAAGIRPAKALIPPACSEAGAPTCGGTCPEGLRCIATSDALSSIAISASLTCGAAQPVRRERAASDGGCECADVRCGGAPLAQDQGCCNGHPFTLGVQGCCHGQIVAAGEPCNCNGTAINLATTACCGEAENAQTYNPAVAACCEQMNTTESCQVVVSTTSTFNFGFDCCPSTGQVQFCDGQCHGSQCESIGCCRCESCFGQEAACAPGGKTVVEGIEVACIVGCLDQACTNNANQIDMAMCTEAGACVAEAPAPTVSRGGLLVTVLVLAAGGAIAIARRRRSLRDVP